MFKKDKRTEEYLTAKGVSWKYTNKVTFESLVPTWNTVNWGRPKAADQEVILEYACRMEAGEVAPAPVLLQSAKGYEVLDGVQRLSAADHIGATEFSAYLVETDSAKLPHVIRLTINRDVNGHPPPQSWGITQAVMRLCLEQKMSVREVAALCHCPVSRIEREKAIQVTSFQIRTIGGPHNLTKEIVHKVSEATQAMDFDKAPKPIAEFLHLLKDAKFTNGDSGPVITEFFGGLNRKKDLHTILASRLGLLREDSDIKRRLDGRPKTRWSAETKLTAALKGVVTVLEGIEKSRERIPYVEEYQQIVNDIRDRLKRVKGKSEAVR